MKTNKRILAALTASALALTPCFAVGMTAYAAGDATLTVTDTDTVTHDYNAYQIIKGTLSDGKLTQLAWGDGIDSAALIAALRNTDNATALGITAPAADASVDDIAELLSSITEDKKVQKLSKIIAGAKVAAKANDLAKSGNNYSNSELDYGWYLVLDETTGLITAAQDDNDTVRSANILQLTSDTAINTKHSLPTLEKKIVEGSTLVDANTAAIGDTITYDIAIKVPDVRGYNKYIYVVEDTLSAGLTFNAVTGVSITGTSPVATVDPDTDGPTENEDEGAYYVNAVGQNVKIVFEDAVNYFANKTPGDIINIRCTATLNSSASIDPDVGNPNKAKLKYSNDPNVTYNGDTDNDKPDEPGSGDVLGETPEDKVNTFTTAIKIKKVDQNGDPLTGATFTLSGNKLNKVKKVSGTTYVEDNDTGTYYKLKTGAYTTTPPTDSSLSDAAKAKYVNDNKKYRKVDATATDVTAEGTPLTLTSTVDDDGYITFYGLNAGEYTITETVVPDGYNGVDAITFNIGTSALTTEGVTWTKDNAKVGNYNTTEMLFPVEIQNRQGAVLPSTGGIGTKLFYVFGGMLVVGSSVVLITKKRMSAEEK